MLHEIWLIVKALSKEIKGKPIPLHENKACYKDEISRWHQRINGPENSQSIEMWIKDSKNEPPF